MNEKTKIKDSQSLFICPPQYLEFKCSRPQGGYYDSSSPICLSLSMGKRHPWLQGLLLSVLCSMHLKNMNKDDY